MRHIDQKSLSLVITYFQLAGTEKAVNKKSMQLGGCEACSFEAVMHEVLHLCINKSRKLSSRVNDLGAESLCDEINISSIQLCRNNVGNSRHVWREHWSRTKEELCHI